MDVTRRHALFTLTAAALLAAPATALSATGAIPQDVANLGTPDRALEARLAKLADALGAAKVGIAAVDLANGRTAFLREGELFPMQGVSALPIAIAFLRLAEQDKASLNTFVRLTAADIAPGRSPMAAKLRRQPVRYTARQLIEHMLLNGDNTATDALLRLAGGPAPIQKELLRAGYLEGIRIDRYERDIQPAVFGLKPSDAFADPAAFDAAIAARSAEAERKALARYLQDANDTASPRAMTSLYARLASGRLLDLKDADFVLDLMRRTKTGVDRLNAGMRKGWTLAHRGGQSRPMQGMTAIFNDTGLATSKSGGRIALAVFVEGATRPVGELESFQKSVASMVLDAWDSKVAPGPKS
jgi:beta-lactamase class A